LKKAANLSPNPMNQTLRSPLVSRVVSVFCLFLLWFSQIQNAIAESWPTQWSLESLENESSEWVQSLRVQTVPGVVYHLQASESLAADSWSTLDTTYGSGGEWICPLFPGSPPQVPSADPPVIPNLTQSQMRFAWLIIEKNTNGQTLASWNSLDDHTPKRMVLSGVTLDPIWEEFDAGYMNHHGNHYFALSPRLATPVIYTAAPPTLGTLDAAMIADFTSQLSAITESIRNSLATRALYAGQPQQTGARKFYRIAADWSVDSDGDGRYDWQELIFDGNNPFAADTDGDGVMDQEAVGAGGSNSEYPVPTDAEEAPPYAVIEQETLGVWKVEIPPSEPGDEPGILVYGQYSAPPESDFDLFDSFTSYSGLKQELDDYTAANGLHWNAGLHEFECEFSSDDYSTTSRYSRARFRLKLDKPAPTGGYRIPLKLALVYQTIDPETNTATFMPTPAGLQDHMDLTLQCAENETEGIPVDVQGPASLAQNTRVIFYPINVVTREPDIPSTNPHAPFPLPGHIPVNGTCVTSEQTFVVDCLDPKIRVSLWNYDEPPLEIFWKKRKFKNATELEEWEAIFQPDPNDPLTPKALTGAHRSVRDLEPGIYQLKAVLVLPDATQIDFPFVRMKHARSIKNKDGTANPLLKAGKPDYFGICANSLSKSVRNKAVDWLGATGYAARKNVEIEPGYLFNVSTNGSPKCNIFVTHIANQVGATTPYFYRKKFGFSTPFVSAPIAKDDWYPNPEINIDIDSPGWYYLHNTAFPPTNPTVQDFSSGHSSLRDWQGGPCPGMVCASPRTSAGPRYGHVGIMDYDGSWINAGAETVNKFIHLLDSAPDYKPNSFRSR
jgi:hypothetical protein